MLMVVDSCGWLWMAVDGCGVLRSPAWSCVVCVLLRSLACEVVTN